jgi:hypothetical protein
MIIILTVLAVARVTRLITDDRILNRPRGVVARWLDVRGWDEMAYLIFCPWCMSVYVGAAAAGAWYAWGETMPFMAVTLALAASYVTGFLASIKEAGD